MKKSYPSLTRKKGSLSRLYRRRDYLAWSLRAKIVGKRVRLETTWHDSDIRPDIDPKKKTRNAEPNQEKKNTKWTAIRAAK